MVRRPPASEAIRYRCPALATHAQIPGSASVPKPTPRSKGADYKDNYRRRTQQGSKCKPSYAAHKGPGHRERSLSGDDWRKLMTQSIRFGR